MRYMALHKCGLKGVILQHPLKLVASIEAASKAQAEESSGLGLRGLADTLCKDRGEGSSPMETPRRRTSLILFF